MHIFTKSRFATKLRKMTKYPPKIPSQTLPKPFQNLPQTLPKPSQNTPKSIRNANFTKRVKKIDLFHQKEAEHPNPTDPKPFQNAPESIKNWNFKKRVKKIGF